MQEIKKTRDLKHKVAFIIPTKDRPKDLCNLLNSLKEQTYKADQLIVVDGGEKTVEGIIKDFLSLNIEYIRFYPPHLTKQRNAGIKALRSDITLVGYLDDDLVLEKDAIEKLLDFWEQAEPEIGGTSFCITNINLPPPRINRFDKWFDYIFCIDKGKRGVILKSGINVSQYPLYRNTYVEWLCGGATVWRRNVIDEYEFNEDIGGYGYYDDVDYSFTVGQKYKLMIIADAKIQHFPPQRKLIESYYIEKSSVINRYHFVKKHPQLSKILFYWSTIGLILKAVKGSDNGFSPQVCGYIAGLFNIVIGNLDQRC